MRNTFRILIRDFGRLIKAPAALVVAIALIFMPSLYAWFNVYGFWNPYNNTGAMRVCVVNEDAGAYLAAAGELDIGNQIIDSLKDNDQLGWEFTDRESALEEVRSGKAYAAFIIPSNFSECITTFLTGHVEQPKLEYYVNEKSGAVSPKITDTGANTLEQTINSTFVSAVSEVVTLKVDSVIASKGLDIGNIKSSIAKDIQEMRNALGGASEASGKFSHDIVAVKGNAQDAKKKLLSTQGDITTLADDLKDLGVLTASAQDKLLLIAARLSSALDKGDAAAAQAAIAASTGASKVSESLSASKAKVDASLASAQALADQLQVLTGGVQSVVDALPQGDPARQSLERALERLSAEHAIALDAAAKFQQLSDRLADGMNTSSELADSINEAYSASQGAASAYRGKLADETLPAIGSELARLSNVLGTLAAQVEGLTVTVNQAIAVTDELSGLLDSVSSAVDETNNLFENLDAKLSRAQTDILSLSSSNAIDEIFGGSTLDAAKIADFMLSPTELETEVLYPLNAYGSAMAPLFINLTLWIGVFMLLVILKHEVDNEGIPNLTNTQRFFGRMLFFAPFAVMQAIVCCAGLLFIGVQVANPPLFFLTAIIASLTYLCVQFSLVVTMQHIGMGLCIVLVFVQIPGATGLYPVEMTPDFFRFVYPLFPFTYGINALREVIAGFYASEWFMLIARLLVFMLIFLLIGLLARPYLTNLNRLFTKEIRETGIINGEDTQVPPRRFRASAIIAVLVQREETRERVFANMERFVRWYPRIVRILVTLGVGVPAVFTLVMSLIGVEKVILLTAWLIWLLIVIGAMVVVAYIRDNLTRLQQLGDLSEEELHDIYSNRDSLEGVPVSHMHGAREVPRK